MSQEHTAPDPRTDSIDRRSLITGAGAAAGAVLVPVLPAVTVAIIRTNGWMLAPEDL